MSKKVLLNQSRLVSLVRQIVEKFEYDDLDYMGMFFQIFMDWIRKNTPEKVWSYPTGFLIKKYSTPFLRDVTGNDIISNDNDDHEISRWEIEKIVKSAVRHGRYTLPSLHREEKFTDKYKKVIPAIIENLELPDYVEVSFEEKEPNFVTVKTLVFYSNMLLSDLTKRINRSSIEDNISKFLKNYLGVELGNPVYGEVQLSVLEPELFGIEGWIKQVLNKEIKKTIRSWPEARDLKSIRFEPSSNGGNMKLVFTDYNYQRRSALREKIKSYFEQLGFGSKIRIEI